MTGPDARKDEPSDADEKTEGKPANAAPDAVKDPNEKTDGKPGLPSGGHSGGETDPGGA